MEVDPRPEKFPPRSWAVPRNLPRTLLTALVILGVLLACVAVIRLPGLLESIRVGLILPLEYGLWLVRLLIGSLDQYVLWITGLLVLGLLLLYGLVFAWPGQKPGRRPRRPEREDLPPSGGRVAYWGSKVQLLTSLGLESEYALFDFRRLVNLVRATIKESPTARRYPAEIETFFEHPSRRAGLHNPLARTAAPGPLQRLLARRPASAEQAQAAIDALCDYLEIEVGRGYIPTEILRQENAVKQELENDARD